MARRKSRRKYQYGGFLSGLLGSGAFGGGNGMGLLQSLGQSLQGYNNEPALQGIFNQSNNLYENYKNQVNQSTTQMSADPTSDGGGPLPGTILLWGISFFKGIDDLPDPFPHRYPPLVHVPIRIPKYFHIRIQAKTIQYDFTGFSHGVLSVCDSHVQ